MGEFQLREMVSHKNNWKRESRVRHVGSPKKARKQGFIYCFFLEAERGKLEMMFIEKGMV